MIKHYVPATLDEALDILSKNECFIMAGGTDLMVQKHVSTGILPRFELDVVYVGELKEVQYINKDNKGVIHIGASTKYYEIEQSELIPEIYKRVIKEIASPNIRNMATMAGNIGNASPAGDTLVPLVLNDATIVLQSKDNTREISVNDYIVGVRKTVKNVHEMITEIRLYPQNLQYFYQKVGSRKAESITKVSFLGGYRLDGKTIKDFRVAFGSVAVKTVRDRSVETKYIGMNVDELDVEAVINDYASLVTPINDQRSNKEYRHKVAMNLLRKFVMDLKGGKHE